MDNKRINKELLNIPESSQESEATKKLKFNFIDDKSEF